MQKGQASMEFLIIVGAVILVATFVVATLINIAVPLEEQIEDDAIDLLCSRVLQPNDCDNRQVEIKGQSFNCIFFDSKCLWENSSMLPPPKNISASFQDNIYCFYDNTSRHPNYDIWTSTDYSFTYNDFGGVMSFQLPAGEEIPAGSIINSATLSMYLQAENGCAFTSPYYFYKSSAPLQCNFGTRPDPPYAAWYNRVNDNGPPPGYAATDVLANCTTGQYKSFDISGAIPFDTRDIFIEMRANDIGVIGTYYTLWNFNALPAGTLPTLEITYTSSS